MVTEPDLFDGVDRETPGVGFLSGMATLRAGRLDFHARAATKINVELVERRHNGNLSFWTGAYSSSQPLAFNQVVG